MTGETGTRETVTRRLANLRALGGISVGVFCGLVGCAKTDVQAPAKEAPSAVSVAPEAVEAAPPPPAPSSASADRWPAAEEKPAAAAGAGLGRASQSAPAPMLAPAPREKSDVAKHKKEAAPPAPKPAKGALGESEARSPVADEAEPALAYTESWTQLNVAFDSLASALALSVPDCSVAERFRQNVCALAERICELERDLPSTTPHHCGDGRSRCSEATSRYNAKCDR